MFEVSTNWLNGAGQIVVYSVIAGAILWLMSKIELPDNNKEEK